MNASPLLPLIAFGLCQAASAGDVTAKNDQELAAALPALKAGDVLKIGPGTYRGGYQVSRIANLTVKALDPANPPLFKGGNHAWQFSRCEKLHLQNLRCSGQADNGINIDDGGDMAHPVNGIILEDLEVSDTGPDGNFDAIKCSGLDHLAILRCKISGWGGQAIDLVGCHEVVIQECKITGKPGFSQHTGPQFKGGCRKIRMENCVLKDAGPRPIQVGGSTGLDYFRPPGAKYEAADVIIANNTIEGGECACAFTGVNGAEFSGNTIVRPTKWIFRILQENNAEGFKPCGQVKVTGNQILFRRADIASGREINIGEGTAANTFEFSGNHWKAEDNEANSQPKLPAPETGGSYGYCD